MSIRKLIWRRINDLKNGIGTYKWTDGYMVDNTLMIIDMEKEFVFILMEKYMKVNDKMVRDMVKVVIFILMEIFMKESFKIIIVMGKEFIFILMEVDMKQFTRWNTRLWNFLLRWNNRRKSLSRWSCYF